MKRTVRNLLLLFASQMAIASTPLATPSFPILPSPCKHKIETYLNLYKANLSTLRRVIALEGTQGYRMGTTQLGVWLQLSLLPNGDTELFRVSADKSERIYFQLSPGSCKKVTSPTIHFEAPMGRPKDYFSDQDLFMLLNHTPSGIIYSWSPHMPLSVEGALEIKKAMLGTTGVLTLVLDPEADEDLAKKVAAQAGFDPSSTRKINSVELLNRSVNLHYPSALFYSDHKISNQVLFGYKPERDYRNFLSKMKVRK